MMFDGDSKCDCNKGFGKFIGFCEMGENGDQILRVNKNIFTDFLLNELKNRQKISASAFFILVHFAYEFALGRFGRLKQRQKFKQQKSTIFYEIHIFEEDYVENFCCAFPKAKYLTITREPINMLEASLKMHMNSTDPLTTRTALANNVKPIDVLANGGKNLLKTWRIMMQLLFKCQDFFYELFLHFGFEKAATIRLEDIKDHPKTALLNLLSWLGVENPKWNDCLEQETFAGFLYAGASQNKIKGFDSSHLKKQGNFFSQNDLRIMNLLLYPLSVKFGYRQKDDDFLDSEIAWYENQQQIETYMDFEKKIIERLKQDFPNFENSQMMAPYFYRIKWAKRSINSMKKYRENFVGFANLLVL